MDKPALRAHYRAVRATMTDAAHARASAAIVARLLALPEIAGARAVHTYWPSLSRREVDLPPLLQVLRARGVAVVLPRVAPDAPRRLTHHAWDGGALAIGAFGLDEPHDGPEVDPADVDVVLVPALAADAAGTRLGYGKGFYDAFLPHTRARRVVPLFEACLAPRLPAEPHDAPVDVLVTEARTLHILPPGLQSPP